MEFTSVDAINEYFGYNESDLSKLKSLLNDELKTYHADSTGGTYKNKKQQKNYDEAKAAYDYVNEQRTLPVTQEQFSNAMQLYHSATEKAKVRIETENGFTDKLKLSIQRSTNAYKKLHYRLAVTPTALTAVLTFIYGGRKLIENDMTLRSFIDVRGDIFGMIWMASLSLTGILWLYFKILENKDVHLKENYSSEAVHADIMQNFLIYLTNRGNNNWSFENTTNLHVYEFQKSDLSYFIHNFYETFNRDYTQQVTHWKEEQDFKVRHQIKRQWFGNLTPLGTERGLNKYFKFPGKMDQYLAYDVAESILDKLLVRDLINILPKKTFSPTYQLKTDSNNNF